MLDIRTCSYRSPVRKKIGRMIPIYIYSPDGPEVITKRLIHWRLSTLEGPARLKCPAYARLSRARAFLYF